MTTETHGSIDKTKKLLPKVGQEYRKEIRENIKTDVESYHKITTTLSTVIPAFSMGLLKFLDIKNGHIYLLKISWIFFFFALIANLISLYINLIGNHNRIENIAKYYLENDDSAFSKADKINDMASYIGEFAFISFILGSIVLLIFLLISL